MKVLWCEIAKSAVQNPIKNHQRLIIFFKPFWILAEEWSFLLISLLTHSLTHSHSICWRCSCAVLVLLINSCFISISGSLSIALLVMSFLSSIHLFISHPSLLRWVIVESMNWKKSFLNSALWLWAISQQIQFELPVSQNQFRFWVQQQILLYYYAQYQYPYFDGWQLINIWLLKFYTFFFAYK